MNDHGVAPSVGTEDKYHAQQEARQADTEQKQRWEVVGQCRHICETPTEESLSGGASTLDTSTGRTPGLYIFYGMEEAWD